MLSQFLKAVFGSHNDRVVKKYFRVAEQVTALEDSVVNLSDDELRAKTEEFKQRLKDDETLDDILPEAFAVVREGAKRALGLRPFDVQLVGAQALHNGMISEMKTGEGKTLVAAIAAYLNALEGKGCTLLPSTIISRKEMPNGWEKSTNFWDLRSERLFTD